ncbi:GNAT family N-acetyltransferase [Agrococcus baldri]|uniref:GNAT family N-acetyltransferase n=1 Tax=Agrococcus baldri TaxID=153730 RepID=UPI00296F534D|nr:GNAT family N-acetyltransferase [Agrococcus baldri]
MADRRPRPPLKRARGRLRPRGRPSRIGRARHPRRRSARRHRDGRPRRPRGWVSYLAVDASHRRQGVGARLLRAAEAWIVEHGGVKLQLMVRADNEAATGFYRAIGYEQQAVTVLGRRLADG